ncbi:OLC1v1000845C1 [Oldenlandia corymbosa var. corymbosa]|uniref:OLC1v1000845C1 n=1 Tax=Oldenlandia corymbosa var. corymbosa TaxID=529605 RepID=A0AAV1D4W9_OLDCO|nr:OLC1v1000845C1 [Oldenlandia corymbosa var. corymbosa]
MNVKRKRDEIAIEMKREMTESDDQIRTFSARITDVPEPIFLDILLKLPLKEIIVCKCVCKRWRRLIFSSHFAKLHFAQSRTSLLLRNLDCSCVPRICYLVDPSEISVEVSYQGCEEKFHLSLNAKLKIPLRYPEIALDMEAVKKQRRVKLRLTDHKFRIVNSCNGFLCLSEPSANEPAVICNPVTGEYINIPDGDEA